jgi:hypothetical protein
MWFQIASRRRVWTLLIALGMACMGALSARAQNSPNARLVRAVEENDLKSAQEALDQGAAPNATIDGNPVSCTAAYHGQTALLKALLDHGARLQARKFDDHLTLLMFAALSGNPDTVQLLLDRKVKINLQDELGETALMTVREPPTPSVTPEASDPSKKLDSPQSSEPAKPSGRAAILKLLLKAGADKEMRDINGRTALMRYANYGIVNGVEVLADAGAKVNVRDHAGNTALILAAAWQKSETTFSSPAEYLAVVQTLLNRGADVRVKNRAGWTALMVAKRAGHEDILSLLTGSAVHR